MTIGRMARRGALAAGLVAVTAAGAAAQKAQWTDVVYVPGFWSGGRIAARAESLALVMRVDYFSAPPKWRAEIRRTTDGRTMGAATILVGNGATALVVTQVGTTPLEQHALGRDSLVRAAVVFDAGGRRKGAASGRIAERGPAARRCGWCTGARCPTPTSTPRCWSPARGRARAPCWRAACSRWETSGALPWWPRRARAAWTG